MSTTVGLPQLQQDLDCPEYEKPRAMNRARSHRESAIEKVAAYLVEQRRLVATLRDGWGRPGAKPRAEEKLQRERELAAQMRLITSAKWWEGHRSRITAPELLAATAAYLEAQQAQAPQQEPAGELVGAAA